MEKCSPLLMVRIQNALKSEDNNEKVVELFYHPLFFENLQVGPTCGFFALEACARFLLNSEIRIESLLSYAKDRGFTNVGECFSELGKLDLADWLSETARHFFADRTDVLVEEFFELHTIVRRLTDTEAGPALFIVPYDCDKNFEPCNCGGQFAHWAIVSGFMFTHSSANEDTTNSAQVRWFNSDSLTGDLSSISNFHVIAYHGKSRHPALWSYDLLRESNAQLMETDNRRAGEFCIPKGVDSPLAELRRKCILLRNRKL